MNFNISADHFRFLLNRFRERLWVKPLAVCLISIGVVFVAKLADGTGMKEWVPDITQGSVETLLSIMAASMMVIATFSVASMVSAYASASSTATPRSFAVVISDDASQNALSTFVGAFIFSIVGITAVKNNYFGPAAMFILFGMTNFVFMLVIVTFVRWVDSIARLGRMGSTINKVEKATTSALKRRRDTPALCGVPYIESEQQGEKGMAVFSDRVGYVQHIDMATIQQYAEDAGLRVIVAALPGTFAAPGRALAYVRVESESNQEQSQDHGQSIAESFQIGSDRLFDDDPRFGLVVLSEIAGRALSPGVNDPGTAINILGTMVRLFDLWSQPSSEDDDNKNKTPEYDRVEVPAISMRDMFDDAFTVISRDGAGIVEVAIWLQKALHSLSLKDDPEMQDAARFYGALALKRARLALALPEDLEAVSKVAEYAKS
ncbi:DUF2254 domain-containing protein [Ketobacter sp. MCCC 1A13808]|uniref:DUF2254 domain-containing protein n=1 Tax=Ketobacter sp. MCCC 1A13808 TaxID=2602738 RepID=UPI000F2DC8A6|nr:DUF2254 domain-containing protein [Ketobacter sp. MCCC 1A13808]MVF14310.1 DUF2254 domain-containing protein [Ketobacter sp. MCCC 1A13808]RLP53559.1 MAG: DUF2254 domain-containing protein [Ketobacter sp.]